MSTTRKERTLTTIQNTMYKLRKSLINVAGCLVVDQNMHETNNIFS